MISTKHLITSLKLAVLFISFSLYVRMISIGRFGASYDDTIYVTAAKALATGEGYRIINLPHPIAQTLIPPFYPFLLSIIWRIHPQFPENLSWMMLFSVFLTMAFLLLSYHYLVRNNYATRTQALSVVALTAINWRTMNLATGLISDILLLSLSIAVLHLAEKYQEEHKSWIVGSVLGTMMGLAFLTRTSALALIASVAVFYFYRRKWRKLLLLLGIASLFIAGWIVWCYFNTSVISGEHASYYAGYSQGITDTVNRLQSLNAESKLMTYLRIIETNAVGMIVVWAPFQSLGLRATLPMVILIPLLLLALGLMVLGFLRETSKGIRLLEVYCLIYVALHLIVPSHSYERYLIPIVPFLLFFMIREVTHLYALASDGVISNQDLTTKVISVVIGLVLAAAIVIVFYSNSTGIYRTLNESKSLSLYEEDRQTFDWIRTNTDPGSVLVCFSDLKYFLYTGRKTVRSIPVNLLDVTVYQSRQPDADALAKIFLNIVTENQASYLVLTQSDFREQAPAYGESVQACLTRYSDQFIPVFNWDGGQNQIYLINNSLERRSW
ncbi:MAG TPA: hypothetical protein VKN18_14215 [Blastocatellia bacterium]|nr:hypothetical protein [Blastocatellia bacterium]